ncbi:MAG: 4-vinyl reductase [Thermoplasmata archaeon]
MAAIPDDEAKAIIEEYSHLGPQSGTLQVFGNRFLLLRPETLVVIQKQLEETVGASTKGIIYLAGERSFMEGHVLVKELLEGFDLSSLGPEVLKRMADILALLGWGRFTYVSLDFEALRFVLALEHSPIAESYGPTKKPACHFLAGWLAGAARSLLGRELLCEETACAAQGRPRCEFQLKLMPVA